MFCRARHAVGCEEQQIGHRHQRCALPTTAMSRVRKLSITAQPVRSAIARHRRSARCCVRVRATTSVHGMRWRRRRRHARRTLHRGRRGVTEPLSQIDRQPAIVARGAAVHGREQPFACRRVVRVLGMMQQLGVHRPSASWKRTTAADPVERGARHESTRIAPLSGACGVTMRARARSPAAVRSAPRGGSTLLGEPGIGRGGIHAQRMHHERALHRPSAATAVRASSRGRPVTSMTMRSDDLSFALVARRSTMRLP